MRLVRNLLLLLTLSAASLAFAASATAGPITVKTEPGNVPCEAVELQEGHEVVGGCPFTAESTEETIISQQTMMGNVTISTCEENFTGLISGTGTGYIPSAALTQHGPTQCTRTMCDEPEPGDNAHADNPWPFFIEETGGTERIHIRFCLRNNVNQEGNGVQCELYIPFTNVGHRYEFETAQLQPCINIPTLKVSGHWSTEPVTGNSGIEISHT